MRTNRLLPVALCGALALVPLAGCQTLASWFGGTPSAQTQTITVHVVLDACDVFYKTALKGAFVADDAGLLTPAIKADIHSIRLGVDSICPPGGTMPTNLASALVTVVEGSAKIYQDLGTKP